MVTNHRVITYHHLRINTLVDRVVLTSHTACLQHSTIELIQDTQIPKDETRTTMLHQVLMDIILHHIWRRHSHHLPSLLAVLTTTIQRSNLHTNPNRISPLPLDRCPEVWVLPLNLSYHRQGTRMWAVLKHPEVDTLQAKTTMWNITIILLHLPMEEAIM